MIHRRTERAEPVQLAPTEARTDGGRVIASYRHYEAAQRAVDQLADMAFPVHRISIVGHGLRVVEHIGGRRGFWAASLGGIGSGALTGALFGFIFGLFSLIDPVVSGLVLALYGALFGAVIGWVFSSVAYAYGGRARSFSSSISMTAERFDLVADEEVADDAAKRISKTPSLRKAR